MLVERLTLWLARTNAWIVAPRGPGGDCVLVDAPPEPSLLLDRLAALDLRPVAVFATHGHVDHVGGISTVVRRHDPHLPVHIHDHDLAMLLDPSGSGGLLAQHLGELDVAPPEVIAGLDDGEQVSGAGLTFTVLHTPGHTPGSVCLRLDAEGEAPRLFSGDHLFAGSIGRTDLPGGSFEQLMASMVDKVLPLSDEVAVLPGHGPVTTIGTERATNPFLVDLQRVPPRWATRP
ncbi:MAG: MBL fold metallo-hydrolase [Actinobacteria bacterium]|nr:MBL fold metallo-hydrolase [Actinomycetota bacterium]